MTTTELTGIQVTALHGLLQNEGMAAPDITELHTQYQTLAAVGPYYNTVVSNIPNYTKIGEYTGILSAWDSGATYSTGDLVAHSGKAFQASTTPTTMGADPTSTGASEWTELTDASYRTYTISYSVTLPSWIRSSMLQLPSGGAQFINDFTQVLSDTVVSSSTIADVNLNNRKVFYTLAEDFPVMVGSTPQQFIHHWGDGLLIPRAWDRIDALFPSNQGCRVFSSVLNQAQGYAQKTRSICTSAAQSTFGSDSNAVTGGTGGVSKLAGNTVDGLKSIGSSLFQSGALVNLQQPWISYSALNVLNYLYEKNALYVGNIQSKVFNKTFIDPLTQVPQYIYETFIQEKIAASNQDHLLQNSPIDLAIAQFMNQVLDSADVQQIAEFMDVVTDQPVNNFLELINPDVVWAPVKDSVLANTGKNSIVGALTHVVTHYMRIGEATTASEFGSVIANLQPLPEGDFAQLTVPTSQDQFETLLGILGTGSGENGSMRCEDCVGQTNFNEVLALSIAILSNFQTGSEPNEQLKPAVDAITAVQEASVTPDLAEITVTDWIGYTDWAEFMIDVKNCVDPIARSLRDFIDQNGMSILLSPYNRMAETHQTSTYVFSSVPIYTSAPTGIDVIIGFLNQLSNFGKNEDEFDAQQIIEDCCIESDVTGQAIIATVREGYNLLALGSAGVSSDANSLNSSAVPVPETGVGLIGGGAWPPATFPFSN